MGFLAGIGAAIDLRVLGFAPRVPITEMKRFLPALWFSFWIAIITGVALVITYPTKTLTNPIFYVKLALLALALVALRLIRHALQDSAFDIGPAQRNTRAVAAVSLACWTLLIVAGRLLPYTYGRLTVEGGPS
jgi:hypothetical protein